MKCTNCGIELAVGVKFCPECGTKVENVSQNIAGSNENKSNDGLSELINKWRDYEISHADCSNGENPVLKEIKEKYSIDELKELDEKNPDSTLELIIFSDTETEDRYVYGYKALEKKDKYAPCTLANDIDFMIDEFEGEDDKFAEFYNKGLENGDFRAYYHLARNTYGVSEDSEKVEVYLKKLTNCPYPSLQGSACLELGKLKEIPGEKKAWFEKAGKFDPALKAESLWRIGNLLIHNYPEESFALYKESAEMGNSLGCFYLGKCYYLGKGVEEDLNKAKKWFLIPAEEGDKYACYYLGCCYKYEEEYDSAAKWYQKGVDGKYGPAFRELGILYLKGNGVQKDEEKAFELFNSAGERTSDIPFWLGNCFYDGIGCSQDYEEAMRMFQLGSEEQEDSYCQLYIARMYRDGKGVDKDIDAAKEWYEKAAENGNKTADEELNELK